MTRYMHCITLLPSYNSDASPASNASNQQVMQMGKITSTTLQHTGTTILSQKIRQRILYTQPPQSQLTAQNSNPALLNTSKSVPDLAASANSGRFCTYQLRFPLYRFVSQRPPGCTSTGSRSPTSLIPPTTKTTTHKSHHCPPESLPERVRIVRFALVAIGPVGVALMERESRQD
jgi:hypothetical protein